MTFPLRLELLAANLDNAVAWVWKNQRAEPGFTPVIVTAFSICAVPNDANGENGE